MASALPRGPTSSELLYTNRELSFLEFNRRILMEMEDPAVPLLERLKFVSILGKNLDEFFMVRVAGLKQQVKSGVLDSGPDGMLPAEQLASILQRTAQLVADVESEWLDRLTPALEGEGVRILPVSQLSRPAQAALLERFNRELFGMLTPLAVDPGHPFPLLKNRALNLAVHLLPRESLDASVPLLAVVQVPTLLPRFFAVDEPGDFTVVRVEDVIRHHVGALFPGMRILECVPFRVLRNWDLSFDEDEQEDLLDTVQKELRRRWRLDAVRLEVGREASEGLVNRLRQALDLHPQDVQRHRGPLAWCDIEEVLAQVGRSDLRDPPFQPVVPTSFRGEDVWTAIGREDVLLHHPYESYEPVLDLLDEAARDRQVLAIKQTLYRVNRDSPLLSSLTRAAENGKQVTALVELKARFDEETNVEWARRLEEAGVHVVYGMLGLKTHCKVTLVIRREADRIRRYVHLGTGNYNEKTAAIYSDLSYFTAREDVGEDVAALFNLLTGYSEPPRWRKLTVAPLGLRKRIIEQIRQVAAAAREGRSSRIIIKSNALIDAQTIEALVQASQAGAQVVALVRGPCTLKVGVEGRSDRIMVRNVVDRFLEHSRILYFGIEDQEHVFITSTDIMPRNFDRRIEVMLPIEDERLKRRIVDEVLGVELQDESKAAMLMPDGSFRRIQEPEGFRAQAEFMRRARQRALQDDRRRRRSQESPG